MRGIDVSDNNGFVNWQEIKDGGIEFAMVACSYGKTGRHDRFAENAIGAHAVGLKVGACHYGYGLTPEDADHYKAKHDFDFSPENVTAICKTFIENLSLDCGVYASLSWLENYIDWQGLGCAIWNAEWGENDSIKGYMWQHTDKLIIGDKEFDGNILY